MSAPAPSVAGDLKKDHPGFLTALLIGAIRTYQVTLGAWLFAGVCRFTPSCSRYAEAALRSHGPARGILLATKRLLRCHPFGGSGYDPPPVPLGRRIDPRPMTPHR